MTKKTVLVRTKTENAETARERKKKKNEGEKELWARELHLLRGSEQRCYLKETREIVDD